MVYRGDSFLYPFQLPTPLVFSFVFNYFDCEIFTKSVKSPTLLVKTGRVYQRNPFLQQSLPSLPNLISKILFLMLKFLHEFSFSFSIHFPHIQKQILLKMKSADCTLKDTNSLALECHTCLPVISLNIFRRPTGIPYTQRWGIVCSAYMAGSGGLSGNPEFYIKLYLLN